MKRIATVLALFVLLSLSAGVVSAQDATPAASGTPTTPLLDALGYPTLDIAYDGTTITAPTELAAGRYRMVVTNTSAAAGADVWIAGAPDGMTLDELAAEFEAVNPADDAAPEWLYDITLLGGTDGTSPAVVDVLPGDWLVTVLPFSDEPTDAKSLTQKLSVTGDFPEYPAIDGAVAVGLVDMGIEMPATIPAGPTILAVTNTGAIPHFLWIMEATGPMTDAEALNGVKMFFGMPDATPAASGSAADPNTWSDVGGTDLAVRGGTVLTELDLEPGTYIAFCFFEGPGDLGNHSLHGMTKVFTVA